jgi:hypothetical protein
LTKPPKRDEADRDALARECRIFARYLAGVDATEYVVDKYVHAHAALPALASRGRFDDLLIRFARGPAALRWPAAAFARVHAPGSALQSRLVTLLAILETAPLTSVTIDTVPARNPLILLALLGTRALLGAGALVVGAVVLLPLRWILTDRPADA